MSRWLVGIMALVVPLGACVDSHSITCSDGRVCPTKTVCEDLHHLCVDPSQLTSCAGRADGAACDLADGRQGQCDANTCIDQVCGDNIVTGTEECDGATTADCMSLGYYNPGPLACTPRCVFDTSACTGKCGDHTVNGPPGAELCDGSAPAGGCADFGFEAGVLGCNSFCGPDMTKCRNVGFVPFAPTGGGTIGAVFVVSPGHIVIAEGATITHVDGATITVRGAPFYGINAFWGPSPTDLHAVGNFGAIAHFDGTTWTSTLPATSPSPSMNGVWGSAANDVYTVGSYPGWNTVKHFDGATWTEIDTPTGAWFDIWGASPTNLRIVGQGGRIRHRVGTVWSEENASACWTVAPELHGIWGSSATDIFVVGTAGTICHFNGSTWSRQWTGLATTLQRVWGSGPDDVFAVGTGGTVLHYNGAQWWRLDSGTPNDLRAVHGAGADVVIGGNFGTARRYAGAALGSSVFADPRTYQHLSAPTPANVWVLSGGSLWQRTASLDKVWTEVVPSDGFTSFYAVWAHSSGLVIYTDDNGARRSTNGFAVSEALPITGVPNGLDGRSPTDVYAFSKDGPVAHHNGSAWSAVVTTVDNFRNLLGYALSPTTAYAVGTTGSQINGLAFKLVGSAWVSLDVGATTPPLAGVYAPSDTDVFAVGSGGTILHYDGTAWTTMKSGITNDLTAVHGTSPSDVVAVGYGIVLHYDGTAWSPIVFPAGSNYVDVEVTPTEIVALSAYTDAIQQTVSLLRTPGW